MRALPTAAAITAALSIVACGGDAIAVLGFIGPAGGDFRVDAAPATPGLQDRLDCGVDPCRINVQVATTTNPGTGSPWNRFHDTAFDVTGTSNLGTPDCPANGTGRVAGEVITLGNCFRGRSVNVIEMVSDDGRTRLFFNFQPVMEEGVWVDIRDDRRRFKFTSDVGGCQLTSPATTPVDLVLTPTDLARGTPARVNAMTVRRASGNEVWSGEFYGVSGVRLRSDEAFLELQRVPDTTARC